MNKPGTFKAHLRQQISSVMKSYQESDLTENKTNNAGPWPAYNPRTSIQLYVKTSS